MSLERDLQKMIDKYGISDISHAIDTYVQWGDLASNNEVVRLRDLANERSLLNHPIMVLGLDTRIYNAFRRYNESLTVQDLLSMWACERLEWVRQVGKYGALQTITRLKNYIEKAGSDGQLT